MVDPRILKIAKEYLQSVVDQGLVISKAYLYGSHARGTAGVESDIDVLIISPCFDTEIDKYLGILWEGAFRMENRIEPFPIGEQKFLLDYDSPLVATVKEEGVEIPL